MLLDRFDGRINMSTTLTPEIINAAIQGFEAQKQHLDVQIAELRGMLDGSQPKSPTGTQRSTQRTMSAAGRKRIAEAQRKRLAAAKGANEPVAPQPTKPKRKLSAAGRAAIVAALKKRWALKRAASERPQPFVTKKTAPKKTVARKAA